MKKRVWRHKKLAPFSLSLEEMGSVCSSLSEEFDEPDDVRISIDVNLPGGVRLEFESIEEMMGHPSLPDVINEYDIRMSNERWQSLSVNYPAPIYSRATVSASSEHEGWCAGVVEVASSALRKHLVWHRWIPRHFLVWLFVQLLYVLSVFKVWPAHQIRREIDSPLELVVFTAVWVFSFLMCLRPELVLPAGAIRVREKEGFIHRYATQIMMGLGLITATAAIIDLFKLWIFGS